VIEARAEGNAGLETIEEAAVETNRQTRCREAVVIAAVAVQAAEIDRAGVPNVKWQIAALVQGLETGG
jgi:hypothetical protein